MSGPTISIVYSAIPDYDTAHTIAKALVQSKMAACVQIMPPMTSLYLWEGNLQSSQEVLLVAKCPKEMYPKVESEIKKLHPYTLPEIIRVDVADGLTGYLEWVEHSCPSK